MPISWDQFVGGCQMNYLFLILWATSVAGQSSEEIYRLLAKSHVNQNLVVSPVSIETILSMVYMGAEGSTAREMQSALRLPSGDKQEVASKYGALLNQLNQRQENGPTLKLANRIYVNDQFSLSSDFNEAVREPFRAEAESISLANGPVAAERINQWVLDQTSGKIKNMIDPGSMTTEIKAMLVNAIYFKGQWESKFDPEKTKASTFQETAEKSVPVQMMTQMGTFRANYFPDLDAQVLELPYQNSNLSMTIFLPREVGGLSSLEEKIAGFARPLEAKEVFVKLPRFKIEFRDELKEPLEKLGIRELFTDKSDLGGLFADKSGGKVSQVSHKAFLEVNEEGAEAAAATSVAVTNRAGFSMFFVADHPFAFVIRDANTVFFQGRVVSP
ncbi:serine protease inhibitor 42Dd [Drosophila ficusphila]|uniref:serine protease inhibitor 42Dd n=1 Tax=Drosophila ficusphila TaxID=30025 RepID=UPI0007E7DD2C|nr:serine protease inhibitor 42Dd [Drosophila ficusphila]